jgi:hypothetical protein
MLTKWNHHLILADPDRLSAMEEAHMTRITLATSVALLILSTGCMNLPTPAGAFSAAPHGVGATFMTVDGAAIDALAYAHALSRRDRVSGRMYGGVIRQVQGGYTYAEVQRATRRTPDKLTVTLNATAVARFQTHPRTGNRRADRKNEQPSSTDRRNVLKRDPQQRPLFILTPTLAIRVLRPDPRTRLARVVAIAELDRHGRIYAPAGLASTGK